MSKKAVVVLTSIFVTVFSNLVKADSDVVAKCIISAKGDPYGAAACSASKFTMEEIDKCLKSSGSDCFGPHNDVRKVFENISKVVGKTERQRGRGCQILPVKPVSYLSSNRIRIDGGGTIIHPTTELGQNIKIYDPILIVSPNGEFELQTLKMENTSGFSNWKVYVYYVPYDVSSPGTDSFGEILLAYQKISHGETMSGYSSNGSGHRFKAETESTFSTIYKKLHDNKMVGSICLNVSRT